MTYIHRFKPVRFNGLPVPTIPHRKGERDSFDLEFESKEAFLEWQKSSTIGLATLDECLNFCKHFVREKGNVGAYEREGKRYYPVDGTWCGTHDYGVGESGKFFTWVKENFGENWYELMERYK